MTDCFSTYKSFSAYKRHRLYADDAKKSGARHIKLPILRAGRRTVRWNGRRMTKIIVNDAATGIQQSVMNFGILMIRGLVNSFGTTVMASFTAAVKIDTIAYMLAQEFGNAYSLFVSQNYGARRADRIRKGTGISFISSVLFCGLISAAVFGAGGQADGPVCRSL